MRVVLIAAVVCATALTFYIAARLTSSNVEAMAAERIAEAQAALGEQLAASQSGLATEITDLQETGVMLEVEIDTLTLSVQSLTTERDDLAGELAQSRIDLEAANTELAAQAQSGTDSSTLISNLEAQLASDTARLADADLTIQALNETIATSSVELEALSEQITTLQKEAEIATARIAELEGGSADAVSAPADTDEQVRLLQAQIAERDATLATLRASVAELTANLEERDQSADELTNQTSGFETEIATLTAGITERDAMIASLETQLAEAGTTDDNINEQIAALTAAIEERDTAIASLEVAQAEANEAAVVQQNDASARIEELTATLVERDAAIAALEASSVESQEADNNEDLDTLKAEYDAQIADLTERVSAQTGTIELLRLGLGETPVPADVLAEVCVARANGILETSQISFSTGTTTINDSSAAALERLRDLVIGCDNQDLILEIGGHTDSQGAEDSNQAISEARAQAVLDFMVAGGISQDDMRAIGFGEAQPIETNETSAGRAANRRITFEWQVRETAPDAPEETASETAGEPVADTPDETEPDTADDAATDTVDE